MTVGATADSQIPIDTSSSCNSGVRAIRVYSIKSRHTIMTSRDSGWRHATLSFHSKLLTLRVSDTSHHAVLFAISGYLEAVQIVDVVAQPLGNATRDDVTGSACVARVDGRLEVAIVLITPRFHWPIIAKPVTHDAAQVTWFFHTLQTNTCESRAACHDSKPDNDTDAGVN